MAELVLEKWQHRDGWIELGATYTSQKGQQRLWYRVEEKRQAELTTLADPFVLGILNIAMHHGEDLYVHGRVSTSLLRNLLEYQMAWAAWKPDYYQEIGIHADEGGEELIGDRHRAICCFSGGVDSCFTAYRHARKLTRVYPFILTTAVLVQGFDIPLLADRDFESARNMVQYQLSSLGIELYCVATNFKEISIFWPHCNGAGVASVLSLFQKEYLCGLVGQTVPYGSYHNIVEGSNPLTDPLLSSDGFRIVPDGAGFQRWEKIQAIREWTEGLRYLRVCWEGEKKDSNCCDCEKCIRNILTFRALDLPLPPSFEKEPSDDRVYRLGPLKEFTISIGYNDLLKRVDQNGQSHLGWVVALRKAISRSRAIRRLVASPWGRLLLFFIRIFRPVWRQPPDRIKF